MRHFSFTFGLSALILAAAVPAFARPDLNSFVEYKISDTNSLVSQVKKNPVVADRYQRHFAMSRPEVVAYLSTLHRGALSKPGLYTIYSVPEGGRVKMHIGRLKKGEAVFLDASGKPILVAKCGNPVVAGPAVARSRRGNPVAVVPNDESGTREIAEIIPRDAEVENGAELMALVPPVPESLVTPPPIAPPPTEAPMRTVGVTGGGSSLFPWLAALPLVVPIAGGFSDGGGGNITPVPEPATLAVMSLGLVGVARMRKKNKK